jgi:hypothetical protein
VENDSSFKPGIGWRALLHAGFARGPQGPWHGGL